MLNKFMKILMSVWQQQNKKKLLSSKPVGNINQ